MPTLKQGALLPDWISRFLKDRRSRRNRLSVWIMDDLDLGYIAVPKAASSSIRNMIRRREGERLFPGSELSRKSLKAAVERRVRISATPAQVAQMRERLCLFSFVRNPLMRLYSCYRDKVVNAASQQPRCSLSPYGIQFGMSFDAFVERVAAIDDDRADQHFRSQHTFLTHNGQILPHVLGKMETIDADWRLLQEKFGLVPPTRERRVSGPPMTLESLPLSSHAASLAVKRYRRDIETFGYADEVAAWRKL